MTKLGGPLVSFLRFEDTRFVSVRSLRSSVANKAWGSRLLSEYDSTGLRCPIYHHRIPS